METSILTGTKKNLGISEDDTSFDHDILTHINSVLSIMNQLGIGPSGGLSVEDESAEWDDLELDEPVLNMLRTYVYLKVRMLFDPPTTSFMIESMENQIREHEHRLSYYKEVEAL